MKLINVLHPANWTKLSQDKREASDDLRRDILFSQILIVGLFIGLLHLTNDLIQGYALASGIDGLFIIVLGVFYYLNEIGVHRLAKFLNLSVLNFLIFLLAATMDEEVKMSYNFFPMAILAFLVFYKTELFLSILFSFISLVLVLTLEIADYTPFGDFMIKEGADDLTTYINVIGSFLLSVMGLALLVKLNQKAEFDLRIKEEHLTKTNKELDRFVYSTSHDLRAPLLSIKGLTNLMRYEIKEQGLLDYVNKIEGRIEDLDRFISEIIDYSRNARIEIKNEMIDLASLVDDIYNKLKHIEGADNIIMKKNLDVQKVYTDHSRLNVILLNLIANSIKYKDDKKSSNLIEVTSENKNQFYVIKVVDNGIGILKDNQENVYKMFYRADDRSDGSGLGLYIVKEMIEKLKGEIFIESEVSVGTNFIIKLPMQ